MSRQGQNSNDRISVPDLAMREGLSYRRAYECALRGDFGRPERVDGRVYVHLDRPAEGRRKSDAA